jgi:hypothetical protein
MLTAMFLIAILFNVGYCYLGFVKAAVRIDTYYDDNTVDVNFADLNNDSFPDLIMFGDFCYKSRIYYNNTMGWFFFHDSLSQGEWVADGTTSDIDVDSLIDIFIHHDMGDENQRIYYNNGDSTFTEDTLSTDNHVSQEAQFFHSNDDGLPDVVFAVWSHINSTDSIQNLLFHQTQSGDFIDVSDSLLIPRDSVSAWGVAVGNMNNDSFPDIFFANRADLPVGGDSVPNSLYIGMSGGAYRDSSTLLSPNDDKYSRCVAFGDINDDGWEDIAVGNERSQILLYVNKLSTDTLFVEMSDSLLPGWDDDPVVTLLFADVDNDDDLDLFVGERSRTRLAKNHIYLNDGTGYFEDPDDIFNIENNPDEKIATQGAGADFTDIDLDGDLDLMVARWTAEEEDDLFINLYTQLFRYQKKRVSTVKSMHALIQPMIGICHMES